MDKRKSQLWLLIPGYIMVLMALVKHLVWAWLLLWHGSAVAGVTSLRIPIAVFGGTLGAGIAYTLVSVAVIVSLYLGGCNRMYTWRGVLHLGSTVAQQVLLMISGAGSLLAIWRGAYLDGTVVSRAHLAGDQDVYILLALFHPLAVLVLYVPGVVEEVWDRWTDSNGSRYSAP